jgi:1-phosphatidylinositol-3-phosphate 5-kinase
MTSHSKFISFGEMEGDELKPPSVLSKLFTKIKINWPNSSQSDLSAQQSQILPIQTSQSTTSKSTSPELPETLLSPNSEKTFYGNHKKRPNSLTLLDPGHSSPSVSSSQIFTGDLIPPHPSSPGKLGIDISTHFTSEDDSSSFHSSSVSHKNALFMQGNNSSTAILNSRPSEAITGILKRLRGEGINKDYWMKDENCKECYECKLPFNTFRRKHHCRICGKVKLIVFKYHIFIQIFIHY